MELLFGILIPRHAKRLEGAVETRRLGKNQILLSSISNRARPVSREHESAIKIIVD